MSEVKTMLIGSHMNQNPIFRNVYDSTLHKTHVKTSKIRMHY